jgi:glycerate-2-kinase
LSLVKDLKAEDKLLFLLSGGASSLAMLPADGLDWQIKANLSSALISSGADIHQINCVRKHISQIKGGGLLRHLAPAKGLTLALSDVSGDRPESIGSGPTVCDPSTYEEAYAIMLHYGLDSSFPTVINLLKDGVAGLREETLKPGTDCAQNMPFVCLASNYNALQMLARAAQIAGLRSVICQPAIDQPLSQVLERVLIAIDERDKGSDPLLLLFGGEPSLAVSGSGRGGRMQHLALELAIALQNRPDICVLAAGTDGSDGVTSAAGAIIDHHSVSIAAAKGVDAYTALQQFNSHDFHEAAGSLLITGATGTNLCDVVMVLG